VLGLGSRRLGGNEELKAYSLDCCSLFGEVHPLDPDSYKMEFAEPPNDP
jgi:hypothetical protein